MSAGFAQVMTGVPLTALMTLVLLDVLPFAASAGVKSTFSAWPGLAFSFVPAAGVYPKLPTTSAVAWWGVPPSKVGSVMSAGFAQLMTGMPLSTLMETVLVAGL